MSECPRNIELFNRLVALTLVRLYAEFPSPVDIDSAKIGFEATHDSKDEDESFAIISNTAHNTIAFLCHEGFTRFTPEMRTFSGPDFPGLVLTLRGFSLLGTTPHSVDQALPRGSFAEELKDALADGAKASASDVVKELLAGAIRMGVQAATSLAVGA